MSREEVQYPLPLNQSTTSSNGGDILLTRYPHIFNPSTSPHTIYNILVLLCYKLQKLFITMEKNRTLVNV